MNPVVVMCDSTADLSPELIEQYNVKVIPLHVHFKNDDADYLDGVDLYSEDVYKKVEESGDTPKTDAVNMAEFIDFFKPYIDEGYDIVFTGIGSKLSSTYQNAVIAAQEFPEGRIELIDSESLSTGIGILVLKMCRFRDEGDDIHTIASKIKELVPKVSAKFCIDRLEYLYKGGRCNGFTMNIAHLFRIHPVAMMQDGSLNMYKLVIGKYRKAVDFQVDMFIKDLPRMDTEFVSITNSGFMDGEDDYVFQRLSEYIDPSHIIRTHTGCVISSHCGPKTIGIGYLVDPEEKSKK